MSKDLDELRYLEEKWRITGIRQGTARTEFESDLAGFTVILVNRLSGEKKFFTRPIRNVVRMFQRG